MLVVWLLVAMLGASPAQSADDPGARAFQRCQACHSLQPDDRDVTGPGLKGVFGRRAATLDGFAYSDALRDAGRRGLVWDELSLDRYLSDPEAAVPGTEMPYQGGTAAERAAVIRWLRSRS